MNRKILILIIVCIFSCSALFLLRIKEENSLPFSGGVVPHHLSTQEIIEDFFTYISSKDEPKTIILLGPDHFESASILGNSFITLNPETENFHGLKIDNSLIRSLSSKHNFIFNNSTLSLDHGITNLLPFIKDYFPNSKVIPFIIPQEISLAEVDEFIVSLNSRTPPETLLIGSVDFSHYLPSSVADFHDIKSARVLINLEKENFKELEVDSWQSLYIVRSFAKLRDKEFPKIIAHSNSSSFLENKELEDTTSYFSVVFEKGKFNPYQDETHKVKTILFVGDIMLDRGVEYFMKKNNILYPFQNIDQFLRGIDIVSGNLEGPIVKNPPNFSDESLKFAFSPESVEALSFANFNLLSLANNHTLNMGKEGLEETKEFLRERKINFIGDPLKCTTDFLFEEEGIIFLAFNKTYSFSCDNEEIIETLKSVKASNPGSFLVVNLHWGNEYQLDNSFLQQKLAHKIIDAGADVIIGHHPHVVQPIESYRGKLIFYSLGNFIFDQYFLEETQQGLAVGLEIHPEKLVYRLFPIQIKLFQTTLMEQEKTEEFLEKIASRSSEGLFNQVKIGIIKIERPKTKP